MQYNRINIGDILQKVLREGLKIRIMHKLTNDIAKKLDFMKALFYYSNNSSTLEGT